MHNKNNDIVNHDYLRVNYTGLPECVLAEPKTTDQLNQAISRALEQKDSILITRISTDQKLSLQNFVTENELQVDFDLYGRTAVIGSERPKINSEVKVAIVTAGTSDDYLAEEIGFALNYFGFTYEKYADIGVAGIHRHKEALSEIEKDGSIKCIIIVAGQDGALFPVLSAQTKLPVIAVPTSIGYGYGGKGIAALQTALQSCSPGIVTVNIDNGFGAASFAAKYLQMFQ